MKVNAQQTYYLDADNTAPTGCDWTVIVFDLAGNALDSVQVPGGTRYQNCQTTASGFGPINHLQVNRGGCFLTFGSAGVFNYTLISSPCSGFTCSSGISCSGGQSPTLCLPPPGSTNLFLLIQIQ